MAGDAVTFCKEAASCGTMDTGITDERGEFHSDQDKFLTETELGNLVYVKEELMELTTEQLFVADINSEQCYESPVDQKGHKKVEQTEVLRKPDLRAYPVTMCFENQGDEGKVIICKQEKPDDVYALRNFYTSEQNGEPESTSTLRNAELQDDMEDSACVKCRRGFPSPQSLRRHYMHVHKLSPEIIQKLNTIVPKPSKSTVGSTQKMDCWICNRLILRIRNLRRHMQEEHSMQLIGWQDRNTTAQIAYLRGEMIKGKTLQRPHPCARCSESKGIRRTVLRHNIQYGQECPAKPLNLSASRRKAPTKRKKLQLKMPNFPKGGKSGAATTQEGKRGVNSCLKCGGGFASRGNLRRHYRLVHRLSRQEIVQKLKSRIQKASDKIPEANGTKDDSAKSTGVSVPSPQDAHSGSQLEYPCPGCDLGFWRYDTMLCHQVAILPESSKFCVKCGAGFRSCQTLIDHVEAGCRGEHALDESCADDRVQESWPSGDGQLSSPKKAASGDGQLSSAKKSASGDGQLSYPKKSASGDSQLNSSKKSASGDGQLSSAKKSASGNGQLSSAKKSASGDGQLSSPQKSASGDGQLSSGKKSASVDGRLSTPKKSASGDGQLSSAKKSVSFLRSLQEQNGDLTTSVNDVRYHSPRSAEKQENTNSADDKEFQQSKKKMKTRGKSTKTYEGKDVVRFPCPHCDKCYANVYRLRRHALSHADKLFHCDKCGKGLVSEQSLTDHMTTHNGGKPFKCRECSANFTTKQSLRKHAFLHTGLRPFKCDICDQSFYRKGNLQRHLLTHNSQKSVKCPLCDKLFYSKYSLGMHTSSVHSEEKSYECGDCGRRFSNKSRLTAHLTKHTLPFQCAVCDKRWPTSAGLKNHQQKQKHSPAP